MSNIYNNNTFINNKDEDNDDYFYYKRNIVCNNYTNCLSPSYCESPTVCKCGEGFANYDYPSQPKSNVYCQYEQKKQIIAFLLEFFVSLGVGHFYAGRVLFGAFKLLILLGPIIVIILTCFCGITLKPDESASNCISIMTVIFACVFCCASLIWQMVDIILFGINSYKDGNGVPLEHW